MYNRSFPNGGIAYENILRDVREDGEYAEPRGMGTHELTNAQIEILRPDHLISIEGRDLKYEIGALEACSLVGQFHVPEQFSKRIKKFSEFERNGVQWGSYGPRIAGDLGQVVDLLRKDRDTRQAVLTIFDSNRDLNRGEPDIPCTIAVQFLFRDSALHMRAIMRSNDVWLGFPYDIIQFFALHSAVAAALRVPLGRYVHVVGSLHLYQRDIGKTEPIKAVTPKVFPYPHWAGWSIGDISARARDILLNGHEGETDFERWLSEQLHPRVR